MKRGRMESETNTFQRERDTQRGKEKIKDERNNREKQTEKENQTNYILKKCASKIFILTIHIWRVMASIFRLRMQF